MNVMDRSRDGVTFLALLAGCSLFVAAMALPGWGVLAVAACALVLPSIVYGMR